MTVRAQIDGRTWQVFADTYTHLSTDVGRSVPGAPSLFYVVSNSKGFGATVCLYNNELTGAGEQEQPFVRPAACHRRDEQIGHHWPFHVGSKCVCVPRHCNA